MAVEPTPGITPKRSTFSREAEQDVDRIGHVTRAAVLPKHLPDGGETEPEIDMMSGRLPDEITP